MLKRQLDREERLARIRSKVENLIEKNTKETGTGKRIDEIEGELLSGILEVGKLLLEDRIEEEGSALEEKGYEITGKKK
jgi:hypothetical protein